MYNTAIMQQNSIQVVVFVASPSDTDREVETVRQVVEELNRLSGKNEGFRLDVLHYKTDSYSSGGPDVQTIMNRQA